MAACAQQAFTAAVIEKGGGGGGVHIDQDLQVYCRDGDLFQRVFLFGWKCFTHLSKAPRIQRGNMSGGERCGSYFTDPSASAGRQGVK